MTGIKSGKVTSVAQPSMRMLHGTYPPSPSLPHPSVKPQAAGTRDYAKTKPLFGDTGMTGET